MARIEPFAALRFNTEAAGDIGTLCCPPYDIISDEDRKKLLAKNEYNIVRLELPKGEDMYAGAAALLKEWKERGVLRADKAPAMYVYEEEFSVKGRRYKLHGLISRVGLEEFSRGIILPHEETLSKAKADRFALMEATGCNFSQIYSLFRDEDRRVSEILDGVTLTEPEIEFVLDDGVTHRLWPVPEGDITRRLQERFKNKKLYIADGHHRYETALAYRKKLKKDEKYSGAGDPSNFVMMMLVDIEHPGLVIFPTHRLVKDLSSFDIGQTLAALTTVFNLRHVDDAARLEEELAGMENSAALYAGRHGGWILTLKDALAVKKTLPEMSEAYCSLDVTMLHTLILEPIFGIDKQNMASQKNLTYTRDIGEAMKGVDSGLFQCAFILNPTKIGQISDVATAGEKMPQKSTYFYPKIITGLVINEIV